MQRDKLVKDLLAAIADFDREASRSIMVMHRGMTDGVMCGECVAEITKEEVTL